MATVALEQVSVAASQPIVNEATLEFLVGREIQSGNITQNETLTLLCDPERLPWIRGTHNGFPAWDIVGTVRFHPGLETYSQSLVQKTEVVNGVTRPLYPPLPIPFNI